MIAAGVRANSLVAGYLYGIGSPLPFLYEMDIFKSLHKLHLAKTHVLITERGLESYFLPLASSTKALIFL